MKNLTVNEAAEYLRSQDNFVILTHRKPDGDTLGSAAALCRGLRALGKTAHVLENPQTTEKYKPYLEGLTCGGMIPGAKVVATDVPSLDMLALNAEGIAVDLALDHHPTNPGYAAMGVVRPSAAAAGEVIYDVLMAMEVPLDPDIARAIYVSLATDTGCFRYSNTSGQTLRVAAACLEAGVDGYAINLVLFEQKRFARLKMDAYVAGNIHFYGDGRLAVAKIPLEVERELGVTEDDMEGIATLARNIEGVELAVTLRTQADGLTKFSVRCGGAYDGAALCARFGGGGHRYAAGASVDCPQDQVEQQLVEAFRDFGWLAD